MMRTTLTLDSDVAVQLERLRKARKTTLKALVNEALRTGLAQLTAPPARKKPYRTPSVDLGRCLVGSLDNVAEVLALAEGEDYK
jgi:hypothetical protein